MGEIREPDRVLPLCAITTRYPDAFDWALDQYAAMGFEVALKGDVFTFDMTDYYDEEMGSDLKKLLVCFGPLRDSSDVADWKIQSNRLEQEFIATHDYPERRPLNLDPGYVTLAKLVLATTKDRDHRLYLRDGMFAEVTMSFSRGAWRGQAWTYPDYQIPESIDFLCLAREKLKELFRAEAR